MASSIMSYPAKKHELSRTPASPRSVAPVDLDDRRPAGQGKGRLALRALELFGFLAFVGHHNSAQAFQIEDAAPARAATALLGAADIEAFTLPQSERRAADRMAGGMFPLSSRLSSSRFGVPCFASTQSIKQRSLSSSLQASTKHRSGSVCVCDMILLKRINPGYLRHGAVHHDVGHLADKVAHFGAVLLLLIGDILQWGPGR
jgi:hypothetical protein